MTKKLKQPITKGVADVPMVMQLEALECGAACLTMILAYYEKWIPLEQIRSDCGVSKDGSNAGNIMKAAKYYGFEVHGYRFEPEDLKTNGQFPCIIHWDFDHFVVLDGFKNGKAYLNDPAKGVYSTSMENFDKSFTGVTLFFKPTENFVPSGKEKSMISFAAKRLKGTGSAIALTALSGITASFIGIISPGFSRVFLDKLLTKENPEWIKPFIFLLIVFSLIQIIASAINEIGTLKINGKMAAVGSTSYIWKVLNMPIEFFSQRMAGDIQQRASSNMVIASTLINTFAPLIIQTAMLIFYLVVMVRYSLILTVVGVLSVFINIILSRYISKKRINITRVAMRDSAKLASATVTGIEMIETIKSNGAENGYFAKWSGYQASVNSQQVKFLKINNFLGLIPEFISNIANQAVLLLGAFLTIQGEFTVGMILAFQGFLLSFMTPANTIITAGQTLQEMRTQMERVDDVMEYPNDDLLRELTPEEGKTASGKLSGKLELKDITFGYSKLAEPLIKNFNLNLEPGKSVAIVGGSGCGKSTVSKLISGLYSPWSGEILFDGKHFNEIDKNVFRSSLAVVDQDIILFEDTIANNIKMWDESIEDFEMILAARDAQIHDDIMQRAEGYQYKLTEGGKDFSGGQRQRMEIARVLAQDPTIIILDEATSALDAKTEYGVVKSIRARGITCIVVAHRLSTIRSCDEILVMQQGAVIARGTHKELMENCSVYNDLVSAE